MSGKQIAIRKHGVRLLNPFRGVMNIIEFKGAEAVTIDGMNWDIYVKDLSLMVDLPSSDNVLITEIRFGRWSKKSGLVRGPIYPSEDFNQMEQQGIKVFEYLVEHHAHVPFTLTDSYELWLLDASSHPLALLSSTYSKDQLYFDFPLRWTPGNACKQYFNQSTEESERLYLSNAESLDNYVNHFAGDQPQAQWFHRQQSEALGLSGINLKNNLEGRLLKNADFPEYFVRDGSDSLAHAIDFSQYLNFLAPFLLTLPALTLEQRKHFEKAARYQALCVDRLHKLYPLVCEQKYINAARVEARLRKSHIDESPEDNTLSPEYIELGVSRTN